MIAAAHPDRQVVFFAIGFETTTPATAHLILEAQRLGLANFSVYCNHVVTPAAIQSILDSPEVREWGQVRVDGFIGPSHVSAVIGSQPYEYFAEEYRRPVVIAGFEPLDVLQAIGMLVRQLNAGRACVENQFTRGLTPRRQSQGAATGRGGVRAAFELRMARARRASVQRTAHQVGLRRVRCRAPLRHGVSRRCRRTRHANARRSSAVSRSPPTVRSSAPRARRAIRSVRAWCRPKAPARPITSIAAARRRRPADAHPAAGALLQQPLAAPLCRAECATATSYRWSSTFTIGSRGEAVDLFRPDVVLAPFLKRAIPPSVWRRYICLIVHPGPPGDRGPSSLDWAILRGSGHLGGHRPCRPRPSSTPARSGAAPRFRCASRARAACIATK